MSCTPAGSFFVRGGVFSGGFLPAEVLSHGVLHELRPLLLVVERAEGPINGIEKRMCFVCLKFEAGAGILARVPLLDCIVESASRSNHRYGSIFQGVDLIQAAGLEAAGHEENV